MIISYCWLCNVVYEEGFLRARGQLTLKRMVRSGGPLQPVKLNISMFATQYFELKAEAVNRGLLQFAVCGPEFAPVHIGAEQFVFRDARDPSRREASGSALGLKSPTRPSLSHSHGASGL